MKPASARLGRLGLGRGDRPRRRPRRLSELFGEIAENAEAPISVGALIDALGDRSFAALLLFFGAINLIPLPPGASFFLGAPMVLIAGQMAWGSRRVWMPAWVRSKSIGADQFRTAMSWLRPRLERVERVIRPRYWPFWRRQGERIVGAMALVLAIVVTLPIPFGNWLPALGVTLLALALFERDGVLLAVGTVIGVVAIGIAAVVVGSVTVLANMLWHGLFAHHP